MRRAGATLAVLTALILPPAAIADSTVSPTRLDDPAGTGSCPSDCSLRQAIAAVGGGGTVTVPAGTYALTQGPLQIAGAITIRGAGPAATVISAGGASSVLSVASGATLALSSAAVTDGLSGGPAGGAIDNAGTTTLDDVSVTASTARGTAPSQPGVGGGIANSGTLTVRNSSISGNTAGDGSGSGALGGGIGSTAGVLTVVNSTIVDDSALAGSGDAEGGGIAVTGGSAALSSVTLVEDRVSGGAALGGNLLAGAPVQLRDTMIALGDSTSAATDCAGGGIASLGWNLSSSSACGLGAPGDLPGVVPAIMPPQLTEGRETVRPSQYSWALDAGAPNSCADVSGQPVATDELGALRGEPCDIGALESAYPPIFSASPEVDGYPTVGDSLECGIPNLYGVQPITAAVLWTRDRVPVPGASGLQYTLQAIDAGHSLSCTVTVANADGTATATAIALPIPALQRAAATYQFSGVALSGRMLAVRGGRVALTLRCPAGSGGCRGRVGVFPPADTLGPRGRWAFTTFDFAAGHQRTLRLALARPVRRRLARHPHRSVAASVTIAARDQATALRSLQYAVHLRPR